MTRLHVALGLHWITRLVGVLMVLFLLTFVVAHLVADGPPRLSDFSGTQAAYAFGLFCLYAGLAVAWFRPKWGGLMSITGWLLLRLPMDWPMVIPAAIGALHLGAWWMLRELPVVPPLPRRMAAAIFTPLAIFAIFSANEIFGQPPLMSGSVRAVAGTWSDETTQLRITPDGAVSGTIGADAVIGARLIPNRSWFGRLMHWRSDYIVRGPRLQVFLNVESGSLTGTAEAGKSRVRLRLRAS